MSVLDAITGPPPSLDVGRLFVDTKKRYTKAKEQSLSETGPARLRVDFGFAVVELIGNLLNKVQEIRSQITESAEGLKGFDQDLAGLRARYRNYYTKFYENAPPFEEWTLEHWVDYEDRIEGPIFYWNIQDCRKKWGVEFGAPQCEGPDLHMALSLLHQSGIALEFEREIVASFYGILDLTMKDFLQFYSDAAKKAAQSIVEGIGDVGKFLTPGRRFGKLLLVGGVAAALYAGYKLTRDDTQESEEEDGTF